MYCFLFEEHYWILLRIKYLQCKTTHKQNGKVNDKLGKTFTIMATKGKKVFAYLIYNEPYK